MTVQEQLKKVSPLPQDATRNWGTKTRVERVDFLTNEVLMQAEAFRMTNKENDESLREMILSKLCKLLKEVQLEYFRVSKVKFLKYGFVVNEDILISYLNQEWKPFPDGSWRKYTTIQNILSEFYERDMGHPIEVVEKIVDSYRLELFMYNMDVLHKKKEKTNE